MNPYEVLEITPNATSEEIKEAYHRLAKKWHPDRFMGPEHEAAEQRFRELAEAFAMVKNTGRPASAAPQPPTPSPELEEPFAPLVDLAPHAKKIEDWFAEAKSAFNSKDMTRAQSLIAYALRQEPEKVDYHLLYAQILDRPGGDVRKLVQTLETILRLNPKEVNTAVRLAGLYQSLGLNTKATRMWDTVRRLDPGHPVFNEDSQKAARPQFQNLGEQFAALIEDAKGFFRQFKK